MAETAWRPPGRLVLTSLSRSDRPAFERLYEIYASLFPLEDEREPPEAFDTILDLNEKFPEQRRFGPYREVVATIRAWEGGPVVGGHIFGVTTSAAHLQHGIPATIQAIYTFLIPAARGHIKMSEIVRYSEQVAYATFGLDPSCFSVRPLTIFEVNDPLRMTPSEIEADLRSSGLHPARRYAFWLRNGFSPLDFAYVQPRLRETAEPVRFLDLFCSHGQIDAMPSSVLLAHLRSFVALSVLKGVDAADDAEFAAMAASLAARTAVGIRGRADPSIAAILQLRREVQRDVA